MRTSVLRIATRLAGAGALAAAVASCSWTRFDDLQDGAGAVLLKQPDKVSSGFGTSLSTASAHKRRPTSGVPVGGGHAEPLRRGRL